MGRGTEGYGLSGKVILFLCVMLRIKEVPEHYKLYLRLSSPKMAGLVMDKYQLSLKVKQRLFQLSAR